MTRRPSCKPTAGIYARKDPCPCGSGRSVEQCCGAGSKANYLAHTKLTGAATHHFFAFEPDTGEMLRNGDGAVLVWLSRAPAQTAAEAQWPNKIVGTVGMGDEKWARFQREMPFVIVDDGAP